LAGAVLAVAAFNLSFRVGNEMVQVWDEALYAITAREVVSSGDWIGTTFLGVLDYYNSKPPLNVWLIALSFKVFGVGIVPLRLPALLSAWLTVALLLWWSRRAFGPAIALVSSLVLATCYGFLFVHSGRTANTDAMFTLLVTLTIVTLWAARAHPWRRAWLGPILAAAFLLKGAGFVMPLVAIAGVELGTRRAARERWPPLFAAAALCALIVGPWAVARWRLDGGLFFQRIFVQDLVARTASVLDGHEGSPFYYLYILQKHQYDWLVAAAVALACLPGRAARVRALFSSGQGGRFMIVLLLSWGAATLVLPTLAATKLGWYLNSFYPLFALGVAWALTQAWAAISEAHPRRAVVLGAVTVLALGVAEAKLAWHSYQKLDLRRSAQSLFLDRASEIAGRRVYAAVWPHADRFIVAATGGRCETAVDVAAFLAESAPGDYWLGEAGDQRAVVAVASTGRQTLYRRPD
jgi:4-amino-4-deoxy-L-arabinose transferase-like glycosyltransferase